MPKYSILGNFLFLIVVGMKSKQNLIYSNPKIRKSVCLEGLSCLTRSVKTKTKKNFLAEKKLLGGKVSIFFSYVDSC